MNSRCPLCDGTGWVERVDDIGYDGHITMVKCADPARVHLEKELERLGRVSGLLPEELAITFEDVILTASHVPLKVTVPHEIHDIPNQNNTMIR